MRFTIERIRTVVLAAAVLLLAALAGFLVRAKWKNLLNRHDLPQQLARDIQQEANGYTFVHAFGAHSQYRIHASREVQLKNDRILLHGVEIDLYGPDGSRVDRIAGGEFEYDEKTGVATAQGAVEMLLTRPAAPPAKPGESKSHAAVPGQIQLETTGVTFDRNSGMVTTERRVNFSLAQGYGSALGVQYDSENGYLTLERAVEMTTFRGPDKVEIHAQHAEFDRSTLLCWLKAATAVYRDRETKAAETKILFRQDGSAARLDATGGFTLETATGAHLTAPRASIDLNEHSQPRHGHLEGGVSMDWVNEGRTVHGTSPTAELEFTAAGQLRHAHLERGVAIESEETMQAANAQGAPVQVSRTWHSPVAEVDFSETGRGQVVPQTIHGTGGVVITSESQRGNAPAEPTRMTADQVTGWFGPASALRAMGGVGHAGIEQTTATGTRQTASGDRLEAQFAPQGKAGGRAKTGAGSRSASGVGQPGGSSTAGANGVQSAELDGHVALFQQAATHPGDKGLSPGAPAAKPGAQPPPPLRATAGKAVYESAGEWLRLTLNPRVEDDGLELTAEKVDVSQQSGEAFAYGNVKATWTRMGADANGRQSVPVNGNEGAMTFGGNGPAHVIAEEAQVNESTGEATFRGHARLWQQENSVTAPVIVLNQHMQTLVARTTDRAEQVHAVLLSAGAPAAGNEAGRQPGGNRNGNAAAKPAALSVIRVGGGDLWYSDAEHRVVMRGGVLGAVVAETATATSSSDEVELQLMPAENPDGGGGGQAQVDRMTATGHVVLTSQDRRGTGERLAYSSVTGQYALTGTASAPPRLSDPARGSVTGKILIFDSRNDSVSIEGGGRETRAETSVPQP